MDCTPTQEMGADIDIEKGDQSTMGAGAGAGTPAISDGEIRNITAYSLTAPDGKVKVEKSSVLDHPSCNQEPAWEHSLESGKKKNNNHKRENRKPMSTKKPPRPPAPRGLSLDAAEEKLIKEISQLAMIKRAGMERKKARRKMKEAKASSDSAAPSLNLIAVVFTILFCVVIIFQGCCQSSSSGTRSSTCSNKLLLFPMNPPPPPPTTTTRNTYSRGAADEGRKLQREPMAY
ncbi:uncharacterized protein LOC127249376 [Andrographis paniculata]|uniref:uncharacterized protein LOC127249376 n=1 Tax=Andrographis paniculata TaxID=175694 RepID=UPI0021E6E30B|nr:uncharacterized protein LOC127249376 [Andrographis paniculata]XP_051128096.1 uncharacterized protein LOC127249376 [Andrographis paniculata]XP_051128097.1 uncharacterized protein LOC127249376 [Andrographis paniculata]XP_051128098.1 uncharacterized protein LOC127249376 [Andrographis paniculata]